VLDDELRVGQGNTLTFLSRPRPFGRLVSLVAGLSRARPSNQPYRKRHHQQRRSPNQGLWPLPAEHSSRFVRHRSLLGSPDGEAVRPLDPRLGAHAPALERQVLRDPSGTHDLQGQASVAKMNGE
jgi:hypothetical protein